MERSHAFIQDSSRYLFDGALLSKGFSQLDSRQDASYYGNWFNPRRLELVEYAEGDVTVTKFETPAEFVGWIVGRREVMGYEHIDDWSEQWVVPIERDELEIYLSYMRDDAIV